MIELKITIPTDEIGDGKLALEKRMAVLGYAWGHATVPFIGVNRAIHESDRTVYGDSDTEAAKSADPVANHSQEAKPEPAKRGRKKAEPAPNISAAPEARVDPEVEAQDEADEAAEVAANAPAEEVFDGETLRAAMGAYAEKFGYKECLTDGSAVFNDALGQPPEGGWKLSVAIAAGGETLVKAAKAWQAAAAAEARYGS